MLARFPHALVRTSLVLGFAAFTLACGGPLGPIAGGELSGTVVAEPLTDWSFAGNEETIAVETRPDDPHSVTTWCVTIDGQLYVPSRDPDEKEWVAFLRADNRARIRVGDEIYELQAIELSEETEIRKVADALVAKYDLERPSDSEPPKLAFFRFEPRMTP
jgi:hypothetical protein